MRVRNNPGPPTIGDITMTLNWQKSEQQLRECARKDAAFHISNGGTIPLYTNDMKEIARAELLAEGYTQDNAVDIYLEEVNLYAAQHS